MPTSSTRSLERSPVSAAREPVRRWPALLDSTHSDARYLALLTAGNVPFPELADGVLRGLFDLEPHLVGGSEQRTGFEQLPRA